VVLTAFSFKANRLPAKNGVFAMENTKIEWADHTMNFFVGCTKVSAACDFCYAESWAKRSGHPELWTGERRRTAVSNWAKPHKWNKLSERFHREAIAYGTPYRSPRVFTNSLADFFDNQVTVKWRREAWHVIDQTPYLDWLILTKRPQNIAKMLPEPDAGYSKAWGDGWPNVWLGTTCENQEIADRNIPVFLSAPAAVRFVSLEPLLGPIDLFHIEEPSGFAFNALSKKEGISFRGRGLDWAIVGGESGPHARPMHPEWARDIRDQCAAAATPFFFKQWGEWAPGECANGPPTRTERVASFWAGSWNFGTQTPRESAEGHIDDEPDVYWLGKKAAGRLLDGVEHNGMPT
jgi:protein gp37